MDTDSYIESAPSVDKVEDTSKADQPTKELKETARRVFYGVVVVVILIVLYLAVSSFQQNQSGFFGLETRDDPAHDKKFIEKFVDRLREKQNELLAVIM